MFNKEIKIMKYSYILWRSGHLNDQIVLVL